MAVPLSTRALIIPLFCALMAAGCGNEPTPEQLRANAAFAEAKSALARGDSHAGRQMLLAALSLDQLLGRRARVAEETRLLGDLAATAASFDSAFDWYARSMEEYRSLADRSAVRSLTLAAAGVRRVMGEERKAFTMYVEALRLARVFKDEEGARDIQWAMLPCARALDEVEEETTILRELLQTYTSARNPTRQAAVLLESGNGQYNIRSYDRAAEDFLRALMLADQTQDSVTAVRAALRFAMTIEAAGRTRDALTSYGDCLKRADRSPGAETLRLEALMRVGNIYLRGRQFSEALRFYRAALSSSRVLKNSVAEGYLLLQIGHCDVESSRENALKNYRAGFELFKSMGDPAGLAYACLCLGHLFEGNNQPTDALQYFKSAIEQSEAATAPRAIDDITLSCEQAYFGSRRTPWYDDAIDILLQMGRYDEAFWYVDRRNSRELFDVLSTLNVQSGNNPGHALLDAFAEARARSIGSQRQCIALATDAGPRRDLAGEAREARARAFAAVNATAGATARSSRALEPFVRIGSLGIPEVQKALPPGTALVQHVMARRTLYAFVITSAKTSVQMAAFEKDRVFDLTREFAELLAMRESYADSSKGQQTAIDQRVREVNGPLFEAFVRPIENAITGIPNVVVVNPRELPWLPLHAINGGPSRGNAFLAEQHTISYLPSAAALLLPRSPRGPAKQVVALGYPGGTTWDVEYELRDIRAFFKDVRLYFDQNASLATLQRERGDVLHIAARFSFNEERPGNSCFIVSDGKSPEVMKRIPTGELLTIPPYATVVISDLDPGRLGIRPAEPYLFMANGSQQIVFTSHAPSRKAKKIFGEFFYTALLAGADNRAAYRKAQLDMIRTPEYSAPHMWAWFTLWGK